METKVEKCRILVWLIVTAFLLGGAMSISAQASPKSDATGDEKTLWDLEHVYWQYVQSNDLVSYRNLWHREFIGWPSVSTTPVNKDHITDWITSQTSKGLRFNRGELKPAEMKITGNIAMTYYWMTFGWVDKDGKGDSHTTRVTHTWVKDGKNWRIIGGMSMLEPVAP